MDRINTGALVAIAAAFYIILRKKKKWYKLKSSNDIQRI
jgi:hypothetical protein